MSSLAAFYVTCGKRFDIIEKTLPSFYLSGLAEGVQMFLVFDGTEEDKKKLLKWIPKEISFLQTPRPFSGVCKAKNLGFKTLLEKTEAQVFFSVEDDCLIKLGTQAFQIYEAAVYQTGIHHFNCPMPYFSSPVRFLLPNGIELALYRDCAGFFSVYTRECLETVGVFDEDFNKNAFEHLEHTYRCAIKGFTTPWRWFADISLSSQYVQCIDNDLTKTTIPINSEAILYSNNLLKQKHQFSINGLPGSDQENFPEKIITDPNKVRDIISSLYKKRKIL